MQRCKGCTDRKTVNFGLHNDVAYKESEEEKTICPNNRKIYMENLVVYPLIHFIFCTDYGYKHIQGK